MCCEYPEAWRSLQYPNMRRELIGYLRDAANGVAFSSEADFDYLVHFVFDDTGHAEPAGMVGATLLSDSEADLLQAFVAAVDRLVASWASQRDITRLDCDGAKAAAQAALDCLLAAGE